MTAPGPEEVHHPREAEMVAYMKRLYADEVIGGASQVVAFGPYTALIVIGALQVAMRHPLMDQHPQEVLDQVITQFGPWFEGTLGAEIIAWGADPATWVVPHPPADPGPEADA